MFAKHNGESWCETRTMNSRVSMRPLAGRIAPALQRRNCERAPATSRGAAMDVKGETHHAIRLPAARAASNQPKKMAGVLSLLLATSLVAIERRTLPDEVGVCKIAAGIRSVAQNPQRRKTRRSGVDWCRRGALTFEGRLRARNMQECGQRRRPFAGPRSSCDAPGGFS
jgi:hypothetical protein